MFLLYDLPHDGALSDALDGEDGANQKAFQEYCDGFEPEELALILVKERRNLDAAEAAIKAEIGALKNRLAGVVNKKEKLAKWQMRPFLTNCGKDAGKTPLGTFYRIVNKPKESIDAVKIPEWPEEIKRDRDVIELSWALKKSALKEKYPNYKELPGYSEEEQEDSIGFRSK